MHIFTRLYPLTKLEMRNETLPLDGMGSNAKVEHQMPHVVEAEGKSRIEVSDTKVVIKHYTDAELTSETTYVIGWQSAEVIVMAPANDQTQRHVLLKDGEAVVYWLGFEYKRGFA